MVDESNRRRRVARRLDGFVAQINASLESDGHPPIDDINPQVSAEVAKVNEAIGALGYYSEARYDRGDLVLYIPYTNSMDVGGYIYLVGEANQEVIEEEYDALYAEVHTRHQAMYVDLQEIEAGSDADKELEEVLTALENYPFLDDELHSRKEHEAAETAWHDFGRADIFREIVRKHPKLEDAVDAATEDEDEAAILADRIRGYVEENYHTYYSPPQGVDSQEVIDELLGVDYVEFFEIVPREVTTGGGTVLRAYDELDMITVRDPGSPTEQRLYPRNWRGDANPQYFQYKELIDLALGGEPGGLDGVVKTVADCYPIIDAHGEYVKAIFIEDAKRYRSVLTDEFLAEYFAPRQRPMVDFNPMDDSHEMAVFAVEDAEAFREDLVSWYAPEPQAGAAKTVADCYPIIDVSGDYIGAVFDEDVERFGSVLDEALAAYFDRWERPMVDFVPMDDSHPMAVLAVEDAEAFREELALWWKHSEPQTISGPEPVAPSVDEGLYGFLGDAAWVDY